MKRLFLIFLLCTACTVMPYKSRNTIIHEYMDVEVIRTGKGFRMTGKVGNKRFFEARFDSLMYYSKENGRQVLRVEK